MAISSIAVMSQAFPNKCITMIAAVRSVILRSTSARVHVVAVIDVGKDRDAILIRDGDHRSAVGDGSGDDLIAGSGLTVPNAMCIAAVPDVEATACLAPYRRANSASSADTFGPPRPKRFRERIASVTRATSSSPYGVRSGNGVFRYGLPPSIAKLDTSSSPSPP